MTQNEIQTMKARADKMRSKKPELRFGQAMMIALKGVSETTFNRISQTEDSPFYDDRRIPDFLRALERDL